VLSLAGTPEQLSLAGTPEQRYLGGQWCSKRVERNGNF